MDIKKLNYVALEKECKNLTNKNLKENLYYGSELLLRSGYFITSYLASLVLDFYLNRKNYEVNNYSRNKKINNNIKKTKLNNNKNIINNLETKTSDLSYYLNNNNNINNVSYFFDYKNQNYNNEQNSSNLKKTNSKKSNDIIYILDNNQSSNTIQKSGFIPRLQNKNILDYDLVWESFNRKKYKYYKVKSGDKVLYRY